MEDLRRELSETLACRGASHVGFADLKTVPADSRLGMPRGLSIAVALDPGIIAAIDRGPTADYQREYRRANALLAALGETAGGILRRRGWQVSIPLPTTETLPPTCEQRCPTRPWPRGPVWGGSGKMPSSSPGRSAAPSG